MPCAADGLKALDLSSIDGKTRQEKISIEALRAITGRIDERMAIFFEDQFAKNWVEGIFRFAVPDNADEIGVYAVSGDSQAHAIHLGHTNNPAIAGRIILSCILDGNFPQAEDIAAGMIKLPGQVSEVEIFDYVLENIDALSMQLAVAMHLDPEKEARVRAVVESVSRSNRDSHLLFSQVGRDAGFISATIVKSAFISLWMAGNPTQTARVAAFIAQ